jgi:hypothetical protein
MIVPLPCAPTPWQDKLGAGAFVSTGRRPHKESTLQYRGNKIMAEKKGEGEKKRKYVMLEALQTASSTARVVWPTSVQTAVK